MVTMQASQFSQIELAPPDPIIGLTEAFNNDANPKKVNLGAGVYQDGAGRVPILGVVQQVQALLLGADAGARAVTVQALGGTGALKVGADFLKRFFSSSQVWISDPSWEEWRRLVDLFQTSGLIPFFDLAYQGFSEGIDADAFAVRVFAEAGVPCLIAQSFSKSFALYRERVGALTVVTASEEEAKRVRSQIKRIVRTNYSSPASHGAQLVASVLADADMRARWEGELAEMREGIRRMRELFVRRMREKGVERDFSFIERQRGMFSYSGLSRETVDRLRSEYSIYLVGSGRVCVAALNEKNLDYVCEAIAKVEDRGSRIEDRGSRIEDRGSRIEDR